MPYSDKEVEKARLQAKYARDKETQLDKILQDTYGITREDYLKMSEEQGHVCKICGCAETVKRRGKVIRLAVDHCHQTGKIRGLLCCSCNRALGYFKDSPENLRKAAEYLEVK